MSGFADGLTDGDCREAEDVIDGAAAEQVVDWAAKALQNRAVGTGSGQALSQLVSDVAARMLSESGRESIAQSAL